MSPKIGVFPASGALGTSTYTHLARITSPADLILISRNPDKIPSALRDQGVTLRRADYEQPASLGSSFEGVEVLNLISYPSIEHERRFEMHKRAIDSALVSGVKHIVYSSLAFGFESAPTSKAHVMQAHLDTEAYLASLVADPERPDFSYTAVRQGIYASSWPMYLSFFGASHPYKDTLIPCDPIHGVAWADRDELGEATAQLIKRIASGESDERLLDKVVLLSGPKVYSLAATHAIAARVEGINKRDMSIKECTVDDYVERPAVKQHLGSHSPVGGVERQWVTVYDAITAGETAVITGWLGELLGRQPASFEKAMLGKDSDMC